MSRERPGRRRGAHLWARLGVRARVTVMFGLGALVFSVAMGIISYAVVRHVLVGEQENTALHQAYLNAGSVKTPLRTLDSTAAISKTPLGARTRIYTLLRAGDSATPGSHSMVSWRSQWVSDDLAYTSTSIPAGLRRSVAAGNVATQTYVFGGTPVITVGVPLRSVEAKYFEIFSEGPLNHTLAVLAAALFGAGLFTTLLGAALGRWASGSSLRPLTSVSKAAVAIAGGRMDTRLTAVAGDRDLEGLTSSFNRMVDQLQERIEREARFTSDVSHELRSPLTTIGASLEVIESHAGELTSTGQRALGLLSADLRRFQRMVGELLEISRSDTGSAELFLEEVDPGELARRAVGAAARSLPTGTPPPEVFVDPSLDGIRLSVDKRRFERVMTNLIENAAHYGGGARAVRVEPGPGAGQGPDEEQPVPKAGGGRRLMRPRPRGASATSTPTVVFSVEDRGPGVAPAERARIFQRFYRGQAAGRRGTGQGTGLGLALVAEHVRLHGGRVWVAEADGGGARFSVELPVQPVDPSETEPETTHRPEADPGRPGAAASAGPEPAALNGDDRSAGGVAGGAAGGVAGGAGEAAGGSTGGST